MRFARFYALLLEVKDGLLQLVEAERRQATTATKIHATVHQNILALSEMEQYLTVMTNPV